LDLAYGKFYAAQSHSHGRGYTVAAEASLRGKTLVIAAAIMGHDGALYLVVGVMKWNRSFTGAFSSVPIRPRRPRAKSPRASPRALGVMCAKRGGAAHKVRPRFSAGRAAR
jgi:hypothetical protein